MDQVADNIIKEASKTVKRTKHKKHDNPFLDKIFQSMIPVYKVIDRTITF